MTELTETPLPGMPWAPPPFEPGSWPRYSVHVTADRLIDYLAKSGNERYGHSSKLHDEMFAKADKDDPRWAVYHATVVGFIGEFSTVFLLRELAKVMTPERLQKVAVDLWECIESGDTVPECLWDWAHGDFGEDN